MILCSPLLALVATVAVSPTLDMSVSAPDRVVYVPRQTNVRKKTDPAKTGDSYNDHFQVLYDAGRKQYYAFWTQGSWEGAGDHHICFAKSPDGRRWSQPVVLAGSLCRARKGFDASWQQPILTKSGRLYCFWNQVVGNDRKESFAGFYSTDGGETWSDPAFVPINCSWINWQRPLRVLEDGRFGVASSVSGTTRFWRFENMDDDPEIKSVAISMTTGDRSLGIGGMAEKEVFHPKDGRKALEEGSVVRLPDGRLFMLMRSSCGHPVWSTSADNGRNWSPPKFLRDNAGRAYLQPRSPCPIYDYNGEGAASGEYFALVHDTFDFTKSESSYQVRGPVYLIWGRYDPHGEQPIVFSCKKLLNPRADEWNSYYSSYTVANGEHVLWYPDAKYFLLGKIIKKP